MFLREFPSRQICQTLLTGRVSPGTGIDEDLNGGKRKGVLLADKQDHPVRKHRSLSRGHCQERMGKGP